MGESLILYRAGNAGCEQSNTHWDIGGVENLS